MITLLGKGKLRKEVVTDGVSITGNRSITSYKTMVFPSDKNGRIDLKAERVVWSGGKSNGLNVHSHILKELKQEGWEEIKNE